MSKIYKGEKERLEDDFTKGERKMQRELKKNAKNEWKRGRKTWIRYDKIQIMVYDGNRTKKRKC